MSVDPELVADLRAVAGGLGVVELSEADAAQIAQRAQEAFVAAPGATWWWTALRQPARFLPYGRQDGVERLSRLLPPETMVVLVVTDDERAPWPMFEGALQDIAAMLREVRTFELWLAPRANDWLVFDTHENMLVVTGALVGAMDAPMDGHGAKV